MYRDRPAVKKVGVLSSEATLVDYKERPKILLGEYLRKDRETPTSSITIECMVAGKRKERVEKEMALIAQQD